MKMFSFIHILPTTMQLIVKMQLVSIIKSIHL